MSKLHQDTQTIEIAGKEFTCDVRFSVSPIIPATGPSYSSGGEPASGGEVEIASARLHIEKPIFGAPEGTKAAVEYVDAPSWLLNAMQEDENLLEALFDSARDDIYGEEDDADRRYDAMRDEREAA